MFKAPNKNHWKASPAHHKHGQDSGDCDRERSPCQAPNPPGEHQRCPGEDLIALIAALPYRGLCCSPTGHREVRLDDDAQACKDQQELKMKAEIREQAERAPSWAVWSELPLLTVQHHPFGM